MLLAAALVPVTNYLVMATFIRPLPKAICLIHEIHEMPTEGRVELSLLLGIQALQFLPFFTVCSNALSSDLSVPGPPQRPCHFCHFA